MMLYEVSLRGTHFQKDGLAFGVSLGAKGDHIDKKLSMLTAAKPLLLRLNHFRRNKLESLGG